MSAINHAIKKTTMRINKLVLSEAFLKPLTRYWNEPVSIEQQILTKVIHDRVLPDLDIIGGKEVFVPLITVPKEVIEQFTSVFRVPKTLTDGRSIVSVLSVNFLDPNALNSFGSTAFCGRGELLQSAKALLDSNANIPPISSAYVELVAENVVTVRYTHVLPSNTYLRCRLANDENLNNIPIRAYNNIAEAVFLATKAYIYNTLIVELDQGAISGGAELGAIRNIIEGFSDADELYEEYLKETLMGVLMMTDMESSRRHYRLMFGGYR
ncbi:MAG: hypothetical protein M0R77_00790 [Gammaproteobacteria bacterium]|nr:hypothetical protein [Acholeplasmataceae bacterium]MCK9529091.1 hypothetical protein [Gammaproteobacteria bacterium]